MGDAQGPSSLPKIKETVLKKRRHSQQARADRDRVNNLRRKGQQWARKTFFKRAEAFVKGKKKAERNEERLRRESIKPESCKHKVTGELVFVIRCHGTNAVPRKAETVLKLLRLKYINQGVFLKMDEATMRLLTLVEPYITWGNPNLKTVRELIYKRGKGRGKGEGVQSITDNRVVEKALGRYDIICLEDIVHSIFTADSNFKHTNTFLYNFTLNPPTGGWRGKGKKFKNGGDTGCRNEEINALLKLMI